MRSWRVLFAAAVAVTAMCLVPVAAGAQTRALPKVSVVASGLNSPRGLAFGPGGVLYVAEGGTGGTQSTVGQCAQVVPPIGPYTGGFTAAIAKITASGTTTVVASGLPSSQTAPPMSFASGVADVAFGPGGKLFALIAGAGCSHGLAGTSNEIAAVHPTDPPARWPTCRLSWRLTRSLTPTNPTSSPMAPGGTWWQTAAICTPSSRTMASW